MWLCGSIDVQWGAVGPTSPPSSFQSAEPFPFPRSPSLSTPPGAGSLHPLRLVRRLRHPPIVQVPQTALNGMFEPPLG
eukprot:scaffold18646_cov90-Isochrysis_galbana.AAC.2